MTALLLSGLFPALRVTIGAIRDRRLDVAGVLVLTGIVVGTLMFSFALEFTGPDTAKGREMNRLWQYQGYRHVFRIITAVWGVSFLLEAALRVFVVYNTSTGTALASSKVTPFLWAAILSAWTVGYGARHKKKGERMASATGETTAASHVHPPSPENIKATDLT